MIFCNWSIFLFVSYFVVENSAQQNTPACIIRVDQSKVKRSINKPTCSVPVQKLHKAREVGSLSRENGLFPPWANLTLAKQGQKFAQDHSFSLALSDLYALAILLMFPDGRDVLLMTRNSDTAEKVKLRYTATHAQEVIWYSDLLTNKNDSDIMTSIRNVRALHSAAAQKAYSKYARNESLVDDKVYANVTLDNELWTAFEKDLEDLELPEKSRKFPPYYNDIKGHPVPASQFMHLITQFAFVGWPVIFPNRMGINDTDENTWAFIHLWAVLGYAFGIDDQYNIALQPDLQTLRNYYQDIFKLYYTPAIFNLDFRSKVLVEALLRGYEQTYAALSRQNILYKILRNVMNIPAHNVRKLFTPEQEKNEVQFETHDMPMLLSSPEFRTNLNKMSFEQDKAVGFKCFGKDFETQQSRARHVLYYP